MDVVSHLAIADKSCRVISFYSVSSTYEEKYGFQGIFGGQRRYSSCYAAD